MNTERLRARRAELVDSHGKLLEQAQQTGIAIERVRGALALCDEMLADAPPEPELIVPSVNGADPAEASV